MGFFSHTIQPRATNSPAWHEPQSQEQMVLSQDWQRLFWENQGIVLCWDVSPMAIPLWGCWQVGEGAALCSCPAAFQGLGFRGCHQALVRNRLSWHTPHGQLWETAACPGEGNFWGTLRSSSFEWRGPWGLTFLLLASGLKGGSQPCHFIYG